MTEFKEGNPLSPFEIAELNAANNMLKTINRKNKAANLLASFFSKVNNETSFLKNLPLDPSSPTAKFIEALTGIANNPASRQGSKTPEINRAQILQGIINGVRLDPHYSGPSNPNIPSGAQIIYDARNPASFIVRNGSTYSGRINGSSVDPEAAELAFKQFFKDTWYAYQMAKSALKLVDDGHGRHSLRPGTRTERWKQNSVTKRGRIRRDPPKI